MRREKELTATIERPATAERARIQTLAEAEQYRLTATATGQAEAIKATGFAEADANKAKGLAQAEIIKAQGFAEAEAMNKKAEAWQGYNQAAMAQMIIEKLPEVAASISAPLAKTEKIVVISSGGDGHAAAGAGRITRDVTDIVAQVPAVVEALTGMRLQDLMSTLPKVGDAAAQGNGPAPDMPKGTTPPVA